MFQLTTTEEGGGTLVYPLLSSPVRIGADEDNDVVLRSPEVASRHAVLHVAADAVRVEDRVARGGAFVDHAPARADEPLAAGAEIVIGPHRFVLEPFLASAAPEGATIVVGARSLAAFAGIADGLARVVVDGQDAHGAPPPPAEVGGRFATPPVRRVAVAAFPWIQVVGGPEVGRRFLVDRDEFVIGRGETCDLCLSDPEVRPGHCVIRREGSGHVLLDRAGEGRTAVNGETVRSVRLSAGDRVRVGGTELVFRCRPAGGAKPCVVHAPAPADVAVAVDPPGRSSAEAAGGDWIWKAASAAVLLMGIAGLAGYLLVPELRLALRHVLR